MPYYTFNREDSSFYVSDYNHPDKEVYLCDKEGFVSANRLFLVRLMNSGVANVDVCLLKSSSLHSYTDSVAALLPLFEKDKKNNKGQYKIRVPNLWYTYKQSKKRSKDEDKSYLGIGQDCLLNKSNNVFTEEWCFSTIVGYEGKDYIFSLGNGSYIPCHYKKSIIPITPSEKEKIIKILELKDISLTLNDISKLLYNELITIA